MNDERGGKKNRHSRFNGEDEEAFVWCLGSPRMQRKQRRRRGGKGGVAISGSRLGRSSAWERNEKNVGPSPAIEEGRLEKEEEAKAGL